MRAAYFDCIGGISGDMAIAAFLDAGLAMRSLKNNWDKLDLGDYRAQIQKVKRGHSTCTRLNIIFKEQKRFKKPQGLINALRKSRLSPAVKKDALEILEELIAAEEKVHNQKRSRLHLHQLADADTILDAVGIAAALNEFKIERSFVSAINLANAAPATLNILKGFPVSFKNADYETVTPTGAAIIKALVKRPLPLPEIAIEQVGCGAGASDSKVQPNVLRVVIGSLAALGYQRDWVYVIQSAIDDMLPLAYEHIFGKLLKRGALDAYVEPIQMKKNRPGILLTVIAPEFLLGEISKIIFEETTTFGIRYHRTERLKLKRRIIKVDTAYGTLPVKVGYLNSKPQVVSPEYQDCKKTALKHRTRFLEVYESAKQAAASSLRRKR